MTTNTKAKHILCAIIGIMFAASAFIILSCMGEDLALAYSIGCGCLAYLLLFPFLIVYEKIMNKRYARIEKGITSPVFYKTNGNFHLGNTRLKNGNIYFCESGILCVCLEEKPYLVHEILLPDISHYQFDDSRLTVFTKDNQFISISLTGQKIQEIKAALQKKGWIV